MNGAFAFPLGFDGSGRTRAADHAQWVRGLIEQILFTSPGERPMRPDFGCGVLQLVFAPNSLELAAAARMLIATALQRHLADLIAVEGLDVEASDAELRVALRYRLLADDRLLTEAFAVAPGGVG
ncbi:GPW/gp25 family protein [Sphingomonas sp. 1P06PA]|uniref:GPW/gp25 family protein n=1 Tax=Sphingomonas sp. 1P06PA TaxID=554121 RepID=UPI0039A689AB